LEKGVKMGFQQDGAKAAKGVLVAMLLTTAAFAQKPQTAESIAAAGTFTGQEYANAALGFSILAPGGWSFYGAEQNRAAVERNKQTAARLREARLETEAANTQVLFQAIPPKFAGQDKQAILSAGIEKLGSPTTAEKYAADQKSLILGASTAHVTREIYNVAYGSVPFAGFDIEGTLKEGTYRQRYLMTVRRGVALFIVATFFDDGQSAIVNASLRSIKFK
jgi:hypothetical protein